MNFDLFVILMIINLIGSLIWLNVKLHKKDKTKGMLMFFFFVICPLIGPLVYILSWLFGRLFYKNDYEIVSMNQQSDSLNILEDPDIEKELNVVPVEEVLLMSDKETKRRVILDGLKEEYNNSLNAITEALEDDDLETTYYAAAVISEVKNEFKLTIQKMKENIQKFPDDPGMISILIDYLHSFLTKKVLNELEERTYINLYTKLMDKLYKKHKEAITAVMYKNIIYHLLSIRKRNVAHYYCELAIQEYPYVLDSYKGLIKYYYEIGEMNSFLEVLASLKQSDIEFDNEILEVVRFYNI